MVFLHRWKFFSGKGNDLNLHKEQRITATVIDATGGGAKLQPITNSAGRLLYIDVLNSGGGYTEPSISVIDDLSGEEMTIPNTDISLDSTGSILSISIQNSTTNWSYPSFVYTGDLYFSEKIPTNLIETEHIFVIEEVFDGGDISYVHPRHSIPNTEIVWKWSDESTTSADSKALFMFDVDTDSNLVPFINRPDNVSVLLGDGSTDSYIDGKQSWRDLNNVNDKSVQINIGLSYDTEGVFERYLELYDYVDSENPTILAKIKILGEVIPEDERFKTILDNIGQSISADEEFIFRDSDINEAIPNVKLLNEKRKEFILEHSNITPYIGSYKAIFNVLNWLGYDDIRLKEYFLNVDENSINHGKYKPYDIPFDVNKRGKNINSDMLPSTKYKKTSLFGLYYDINRESGKIDTYGIPETEDAFMFTIEEVLIKLFALKKYLKDKFLPLNARIIDVIGEGIYFERYRINSWTDGTKIMEYNLTRDAKFTCNPENPLTMDLRELNKYDLFQPAILKPLIDTSNGSIQSIHIIDPGFGYVGPVNIEISGGGSHDHAVATVQTSEAGSILSVDISYNGSGYGSAPSLHISPEPNETLIIPEMEYYPVGFFDSINNMTALPDTKNIPVGAVTTLSTSSFDINWDGLQYPWDDFEFDFSPAVLQAVILNGELVNILIIDGGNGYTSLPTIDIAGGNPTEVASVIPVMSGGSITGVNISDNGSGYTSTPVVSTSGGVPVSSMNSWDTIGIGEFYEMEWIVSGPRGFYNRKRGRVDELSSYDIIVPYVGSYDVELILYDTDNNWTNSIQNSCFTVTMPEVEMTAFTRYNKCNEVWDDLDVTWDNGDFMWILPSGHDTVWDDMDLAWDDFELSKYNDVHEDPFPIIEEHTIKRLSETDRYLGVLSHVDHSTKTLTVSNPSVQPRTESGDFIYLRHGDITNRTQVSNILYDYTLEDLDIINAGEYTISYNPIMNPTISVLGDWTGYIGGPAHNIRLSIDNSTGTTATAVGHISASLSTFSLVNTGDGYTKTVNNAQPVHIADLGGGNVVYNIEFQPPSNPSGSVAKGPAIFNNGTFVGWWNGDPNTVTTQPLPNDLGGGYDSAITWATILDANGEVITNIFSTNPVDFEFATSITGGLNKVSITNNGSGYITPPSVSVYPTVVNNAIVTSSLSDIASRAIVKVNNLPPTINKKWQILREIGRTVLLSGNHLHTEDNTKGIKKGTWLNINSTRDNILLKGLQINNILTDANGLISGISITGDYTQQFIEGEKCSLYRERSLSSGVGTDEFEVNSELGLHSDNVITIYNPSFDLSEITPGFHELVITRVGDNYTQRVLVVHKDRIINNTGEYYVLEIESLDGDIGLLNNQTDTLVLYYKYFEFPALISESSYVNGSTDVVLNINDWPLHNNFTTNDNDWIFDYGIVTGNWSLMVTDIGKEGNDTLITVDDPNSFLWQASSGFVAGWRNFDTGYAKSMLGLDTIIWDNITTLEWDAMCHLTWDMTDNINYNYCGFRIKKVSPSGRIKMNEDAEFEFVTINPDDSTINKLKSAVIELNNTSVPGLSGFEYYLMDGIPDSFIAAVSRTPGGDSLGYIRFSNGVEGEYTSDPTLSHTFPINNTTNPLWESGYYGPNNKPAYWDFTRRVYDDIGVDPNNEIGWYPSKALPRVYESVDRKWESERIPYLSAVGGSFTWSDTYISPRNSSVPVLTTMVFSAANCDIPGKDSYLWEIIDSKTDELLIETTKPYLIWTFTYEGDFDILLSITDNNGNVNSKLRKGFINVYKI